MGRVEGAVNSLDFGFLSWLKHSVEFIKSIIDKITLTHSYWRECNLFDFIDHFHIHFTLLNIKHAKSNLNVKILKYQR